MTTDILLDQVDGDWVVVEGNVLALNLPEVEMDSARRAHGDATGGRRRALAHTLDDGLAINFNGDYKGGVIIRDVEQISLRSLNQSGAIELPKDGEVGELKVIHTRVRMGADVIQDEVSLWLCVGHPLRALGTAVEWRQVQLGDAVTGTT